MWVKVRDRLGLRSRSVVDLRVVDILVVDVRLDMDELTVHWIVSDCDLGEVSGYTPSKGCVGLRVCGLHTGVRGHVANMCPGS